MIALREPFARPTCSGIVAAWFAVMILILPATLASASETRDYRLATAGTDGTYYPVGVAIATLVKVKLRPRHDIVMNAISSAGSNDNITLLREDTAQFAILQSLFGYYAWNGLGPLKDEGPQTGLRSVSMLWQDVEQFTILRQSADSGTIADLHNLRGRTLALGKKGSGAIESNRYLLSQLGIDIDRDFDLSYGGFGASAKALMDGEADGMSTPAGVPTAVVVDVFEAMGDKVVLLEFTDEQLQQADAGLILWARHTIPAGTYPGLARDIQTIAQPNFLAVRADVDEEAVYLITKTMYENLPFLNAIHPATAAMKIEDAIVGLQIPLHPGAARYYREAGVDVPDALIASSTQSSD